MNKQLKVLATLLGVFVLVSCHSKPHKNESANSSAAPQSSVSERIRSQKFNFDVFNAVFSNEVAKNPDQNVLISPTSIKLALGLLLLGSRGETETLIADVLGYPGVPRSEVAKEFQELIARLESKSKRNGKVEFNVANGLFLTSSADLKKPYLDDAFAFFQAKPMTVKSADPINKWVKEKTKGHIPKILESLDINSLLVLVNAMYFKGSWQKVYRKSQGSFTTNAHKTLANIEFAESDADPKKNPDGIREEYGVIQLGSHEYTVLKKKYARTEGAPALSMYFILPPEGVNANYVATQTIGNPAFWAQVEETVHETQLAAVRFPIVELGSNIDLKGAFMNMKSSSGQSLGRIFQVADLKDISDRADYVGQAKHRTSMKIDEKGTVATAATAVEVDTRAIFMPPSFVVDRPYMIALRDDDKGEFIFLGVVNDPSLK